MEYRQILEILAPCGLSCQKCFANASGEIRQRSAQLRELLGSFDIYAQRFSQFLPVFENYPQFKTLLEYFSQADCVGCRNGTCKHPDCGVIRCFKSKGVDYCFQCDEFPCDKTNFDPHLLQRWIDMNMRMKSIGVEAFYEETKELPRYR